MIFKQFQVFYEYYDFLGATSAFYRLCALPLAAPFPVTQALICSCGTDAASHRTGVTAAGAQLPFPAWMPANALRAGLQSGAVTHGPQKHPSEARQTREFLIAVPAGERLQQ